MRPERTPDRSPRALPALLAVVAASFALGGCATPGGDAAREGAADRAVATELAAVFARAYPPLDTTVQVNRAVHDPSLERLVDAFAGQGFGIQRVSADQGAHYLTFSRDVRAATDGGGSLITWRLSVGELEARRAYALGRDGRLVTAGPLALIGATVAMGDDALADSPIAPALPAHGRVVQVEASDDASRSAPGGARVADGLDADFSDHHLVARRAIAFAAGSTTLGASAHRELDAFVDAEGHAGDRVGVLGCGDAADALALGRTRVVARALVTRGLVAVGRYGEPCRATSRDGAGADGHTADDVLVELWRRDA